MNAMDTSNPMESQILKLIHINEQEIDEANNRLKILTDEKETLEKFLDIYRNRILSASANVSKVLKPQMFIGKSVREALHLIAKNNDQLIIAKDAVRLLKEANMFGNPANASSVVYSALSNPEFIKVDKGVFRLSEHKRISNRTKPQKRIRKTSLPGLKETMKLLRDQNPNITKIEMTNLFIKQGFDFKGRSPIKSINRAWLNLGYDKISQQPLFSKPEVNIIQVPDEVSQKINP